MVKRARMSFQTVLSVVLGALLWKEQMLSLLHEYHYKNVKKEDIPAYTRQMGIGLIAENLARMEWTAGSSFEEVLLIESGRLRRFGATVIITSVLSGELVEIMCQMRRIGPALRLYLITVNPSDPDLMPFVSRLQQASCEVCYVSPAGTA